MLAGMVTRMVRPFEQGRFYRLAAERMSLATAARSGVVGFSASEGWAACSGVFAYSLRRGVGYYDAYQDAYRDGTATSDPTAAVSAVWQANTAATDAALTLLINRALLGAGYRRADGTAVR